MSGTNYSARETLVAHEVKNGQDSVAIVTDIKGSSTVVVARKKKGVHWKPPRQLPWAIIIIVGLGVTLLISIIICIVLETIRSSAHLATNSPPYHSNEDMIYHMEIVNYINGLSNSTWRATYNRFASRGQEMGSVMPKMDGNMSHEHLFGDTVRHLRVLKRQKLKLPVNFDARLHWPQCWSVHQVANQGGCGSCWAMSATSVMSDRICIGSNFTVQTQVSAQDLISCCSTCGGCQGAHWALAPFTHWKEHGVVSGGSFGSFEGCKPYVIPPDCGAPCSVDYYEKQRTLKCEETCQELHYKNYSADLTRGEKAYWICAFKGYSETMPTVRNTIKGIVEEDNMAEIIKMEVYLYGPILACFTVQEDFQHYSSGIYRSSTYRIVKDLYGHCAKLIGWGEDNGEQYWLYMNTWGREWGENGFFRIAIDELPEEAVAGTASKSSF